MKTAPLPGACEGQPFVRPDLIRSRDGISRVGFRRNRVDPDTTSAFRDGKPKLGHNGREKHGRAVALQSRAHGAFVILVARNIHVGDKCGERPQAELLGCRTARGRRALPAQA